MESPVWTKELSSIGRALTDLSEALDELPQDLRQMFLLHRIGGASFEHIAQLSRRDPDAVEDGICRTLAHLERTLFHKQQ